MKTMLWVAAGGACGAVLRHAVQLAADGARLPFGTFAVNVAGSFAIGLLLGGCAGAPWFEGAGRAFLVVGMLGAFTTFSAFSADALALLQQGRMASAAGYVAATVAACLLAAGAGWRLAGLAGAGP